MTELQRTKANAIITSLSMRHTGKDRRVTAAALAKEIGLKGKCADRRARELIHELRKEGAPICSSNGLNNGYYYAANYAEGEEAVAEMRKHTRSVFEACAGIVRGLNASYGTPGKQLDLGFGIYESPHEDVTGPRFTTEDGRP